MRENLRLLSEDVQYMKGALGHYIGPDVRTMFHLASMPSTTLDMMKAFVKRYKFNHQDGRRHPEYRCRLTMMCMGQYWEKSTGIDLLKHPDALEAASIFVNYIYALDDFIDAPEAQNNFMDLRSVEANMRMGRYSGKDMNTHFANTVVRGMKKLSGEEGNIREKTKVLLERVENYTRHFFSFYEDKFMKKTESRDFTIEEALHYRDEVSAEMGAVISDILSTMSNVDENKASKARNNLRTVCMAGQLQDEWWDLAEELDSGKNILALVLKKYPSEHIIVKNLQQMKDYSLIPFNLLKKKAPNTMKEYFSIYKNLLERADDSFVVRDMLNMWYHLMPITRNVPQKWVNYGLIGANNIQ